MEKIKLIPCFLFALIMPRLAIYAQETDIIRPGLIRAQLTLSPSYLFSGQKSYFYLHGNAEAFLNKNLSVAGEGYYYLGNTTSNPGNFDYNHSVLWGFYWHFINDQHDLYLGLQPGISITKLNASEYNLKAASTGINPLISTVAGYNFFINNVFHFFLQTRIIAGEHNYNAHENLTEFRFSAGLGFNINTIKENK